MGIDGGRIGGAGYLIPTEDYPEHPNPFANVTHTYALGDLTALHEIGHIFNGRHEVGCSFGTGTIPAYACGYAPIHCQWQTMMGSYTQCGFDFEVDPDDQPVVRLARWSNPNVDYNGEPTGVPGAGPTGRNMAAALNVNMPHAATWKGSQASQPSAPDPISNLSHHCWGLNTVYWTEQPGLVEYRLYQSESPNFSSPMLIYSGSGTATGINVDQTTYLRVKACNSGGCSPDSAQVTATYTPGCL